MVLYSRKQFGELCGKSAQQIGVCINRDKSIIEVDKRIDIQNPINKAFLAKVTVADVNKDIEQKYKIAEQAEKTVNEEIQENNSPSQKKGKIEAGNIDFIIKQHQLKKIIIETNLKNLEYAKKKKKILPLKLAATNINTFLHGTVGKVKNEIDKFLENEFDSDVVLIHKKALHMMIDDSIKNSIQNAINEMEKEAEEYSLVTSW